MDNGWQILSPEMENGRKKNENLIYKLILCVGFPVWIIFLLYGLYTIML